MACAAVCSHFLLTQSCGWSYFAATFCSPKAVGGPILQPLSAHPKLWVVLFCSHFLLTQSCGWSYFAATFCSPKAVVVVLFCSHFLLTQSCGWSYFAATFFSPKAILQPLSAHPKLWVVLFCSHFLLTQSCGWSYFEEGAAVGCTCCRCPDGRRKKSWVMGRCGR